MKQEYQLLYQEMLQEIERCIQLNLPEMERVESCFWIAQEYWEKLKSIIKQKDFNSDQEEIDFFREVKPQFTCYMEYFIILAESVKFVPMQINDAIEFWEQELQRVSRFYAKYKPFIDYYETGRKDDDPRYFQRQGNGPNPSQKKFFFDNDPELMTSHDCILRSYLAHKKYSTYIRAKLERLRNANELTVNDHVPDS